MKRWETDGKGTRKGRICRGVEVRKVKKHEGREINGKGAREGRMYTGVEVRRVKKHERVGD